MNMKSVKSPKDINLSGVSVEIERKDGSICGIILRDSGGTGRLDVRQNGYGSIEVLVPAPPKLVGRWLVSGKLGDVSIDEVFVHEFEASARIAELNLGPECKPEKVIVEE